MYSHEFEINKYNSQGFLTEDFVESMVYEYINDDYYKCKNYYIGRQQNTVKGKVADVLHVCLRKRRQPYISVIEAKSRSTLGNLKFEGSIQKRVVISRIMTILLFTFVFVYYRIDLQLNGLSVFVTLCIYTAFVSILGFILLKTESILAKEIPAIRQLNKYPSNENWIAISTDTFDKDYDLNNLYNACKRSGIGLIMVNEYGEIDLKLKPLPRLENNNYLNSYQKEQEILEEISESKGYYKSPSERRKIYLHLKYFSYIMIVVIPMLLLSQSNKSIKYYNSDIPLLNNSNEDQNYQIEKQVNGNEFENGLITEEETSDFYKNEQPCEYFEINTPKYIIVDKICKSRVTALERIKELSLKGITKIEYIDSDCINSWIKTNKYIVHTNTTFNSIEDAEKIVDKYIHQLNESGLECSYCKPTLIKPRN